MTGIVLLHFDRIRLAVGKRTTNDRRRAWAWRTFDIYRYLTSSEHWYNY